MRLAARYGRGLLRRVVPAVTKLLQSLEHRLWCGARHPARCGRAPRAVAHRVGLPTPPCPYSHEHHRAPSSVRAADARRCLADPSVADRSLPRRSSVVPRPRSAGPAALALRRARRSASRSAPSRGSCCAAPRLAVDRQARRAIHDLRRRLGLGVACSMLRVWLLACAIIAVGVAARAPTALAAALVIFGAFSVYFVATPSIAHQAEKEHRPHEHAPQDHLRHPRRLHPRA